MYVSLVIFYLQYLPHNVQSNHWFCRFVRSLFGLSSVVANNDIVIDDFLKV